MGYAEISFMTREQLRADSSLDTNGKLEVVVVAKLCKYRIMVTKVTDNEGLLVRTDNRADYILGRL